MKLKCNVCIESPIVVLENPIESETAYCPNCDKQLAYGILDAHDKPFWSVIDGSYDENFGSVPVEIIEHNQAES